MNEVKKNIVDDSTFSNVFDIDDEFEQYDYSEIEERLLFKRDLFLLLEENGYYD